MDRTDNDVAIDILCDGTVQRCHASLQRTIAAVREDVAALVSASSSPIIDVVRMEFTALADRLHSHLAKEENLLFPAFLALAEAARTGLPPPPQPFVTVLHPIRLMEAEHVRIEATLDHLRELARVVGEPENLSPAFTRFISGLATLDDDLRAHHRMENEVLFPNALELERRLFRVG